MISFKGLYITVELLDNYIILVGVLPLVPFLRYLVVLCIEMCHVEKCY